MKISKIKGFLGNYWIKSSLLTIMQRLSMVVFGVGSYMILVRIMTKEEVGVWSLFLAITTTFELTKSSLIKNAFINYFHYTNNEEEKIKISTGSLIMNITYTLIFIFLIILFGKSFSAYLNSPDLYKLLKIYSCIALVLIPFSHFEYIQQANLSFKGTFISYFTRQGIFFIIVFLLFFIHKDIKLITLSEILLISTFFGTILSLRFTLKFTRLKFIISTYWIGKLFSYGKYMFGTGICSNIFGSMDKYMTASLLGNSAVAYYDLNARVNNLIDVPTSAAADVLFPKSSKEAKEIGVQKSRELYEKVAGTLAAIIIPISILIFLFTNMVITLLAGKRYLDASTIIRISMLYAFLRPIQIQASNVLNSINKPQITFLNNLLTLIVNLALNFYCIHYIGLLGAAIATLISTLFNTSISMYFLKRYTKAKFVNVFSEVIICYKNVFYFSKLAISNYVLTKQR